MAEKRTCSFCGNAIEPGTGKLFIKKDGTVYYFCDNKCKKNRIDLGRVPRRTRWTVRYAELKATALKRERGEMAKDEPDEALEEEEIEEKSKKAAKPAAQKRQEEKRGPKKETVEKKAVEQKKTAAPSTEKQKSSSKPKEQKKMKA